jgi:hypothetical protein
MLWQHVWCVQGRKVKMSQAIFIICSSADVVKFAPPAWIYLNNDDQSPSIRNRISAITMVPLASFSISGKLAIITFSSEIITYVPEFWMQTQDFFNDCCSYFFSFPSTRCCCFPSIWSRRTNFLLFCFWNAGFHPRTDFKRQRCSGEASIRATVCATGRRCRRAPARPGNSHRHQQAGQNLHNPG